MFSLFDDESEQKNTLEDTFKDVRTTDDVKTFEKIRNKLCEKRGQLEEKLNNQETSMRALAQGELEALKSSMKVIGITDIEYEIYLANKKKQPQGQNNAK